MWALYLARDAVLLIYVSVLFAIGLSPGVRFFERRRLWQLAGPRASHLLAISAVYVAILGAFAAIGIAVVPPLLEQATELSSRVPEMIDAVQTFLIEHGFTNRRVTFLEALEQTPATTPETARADVVSVVIGTIWGIVGGLFGLITILFLTFYLLLQADSIMVTFVSLFPRRDRTRVAEVSHDIAVRVSAWLGGQLAVSAIVGTSTAIWLYLLGVPYFYVLALITAAGEIIPVVGPILAAIPALAVAYTVSPRLMLVVLVVYTAQQQLSGNLLLPQMMERQVGVNAVSVLVALLIGASLMGFAGALLAVPTAAIVQVLFQQFIELRGSESD